MDVYGADGREAFSGRGVASGRGGIILSLQHAVLSEWSTCEEREMTSDAPGIPIHFLQAKSFIHKTSADDFHDRAPEKLVV
jgi:hypothetical protein